MFFLMFALKQKHGKKHNPKRWRCFESFSNKSGNKLLWNVFIEMLDGFSSSKNHLLVKSIIPPGTNRWRSPLPCIGLSWPLSQLLGVAPSTFIRMCVCVCKNYLSPFSSRHRGSQPKHQQKKYHKGEIFSLKQLSV